MERREHSLVLHGAVPWPDSMGGAHLSGWGWEALTELPSKGEPCRVKA